MSKKRRRKQQYKNKQASGGTAQRGTATCSSLEEDLLKQRVRQQKQQQQQQRHRKNRKNRDDHNDSGNAHSSFGSIEDDLRAQRMRQQQQQQQQLEQRQNIDPMERAPDQRQRRQKNRHLPLPKSNEIVEYNLQSRRHQLGLRPPCLNQNISAITSFDYLFASQHTATSQRFTRNHRMRFRHLWHGRYILETLSLNRHTNALFGIDVAESQYYHSYRTPDGTYCTRDLAPKFHLHPSARTIDVSMNSSFDNDNDHDQNRRNQPPSVASIVNGGISYLSSNGSNSHGENIDRSTENEDANRTQPAAIFKTIRSDPVQAVRFSKHRVHSKYVGAITKAKWRGSHHQFALFDPSHRNPIMMANLLEPVHDFCFRETQVIFAPLKPRFSDIWQPLFIPIFGNTVMSLPITNFPQSDALRIELNNDDDKLIAFGHRNGVLSLYDIRNHTCTTTTNAQSAMGSITDIKFMNTNHIMVKRSFGCCQLIDMRMSAEVVHTFSPPCCHPTLSANTNGMITNSDESVLLSTFITTAGTDCCIGVWSIATGQYLGQRVLQYNSNKDRIFAELCQTQSTSWIKLGNFSPTKRSSLLVNGDSSSLCRLDFPERWI